VCRCVTVKCLAPNVATTGLRRFSSLSIPRAAGAQSTIIVIPHFANSGKEALDKLATGIEPQLIVILSDINMPVMNGLELLREIKTRRPDLPVMMVTAYGDDERRGLASEYGAAEFITKPIDFDFLKTQLRDLSDAAD